MTNNINCSISNKRICYNPWKSNPSTSTIIPSNSRPIPQPRKWHSNNASWYPNPVTSPDEIIKNDYVSGAGFIPRRYITSGGRPGHWVSAAPNPIKHWRKQLFPRQDGQPTGKASISQLERPGGSINENLFNKNINYGSCVNSISIYIDEKESILKQSCDEISKFSEQNNCKPITH